ncbi:SIS domain-containing protein [Methylibium sp.]|uniref:D-sedoheptulose-7-phosphate isomerase n=1 Tax=Methylibium sp. TaxID=2067992 RepID=UPI00286CADDB|nr:SIS domain-containing protein [Methylibium sp.]
MGHEALQSLYPFLHGGKQDAGKLEAALLDAVRLKAEDSVAVKRAFFERNGAKVVAMAHALAAVYQQGGRLYTMGNGGSSCDATHIAVEFGHPITAGRPALAAVSLVADTAMLTAVGNDVGIDHIFVRPLIAQARRGDGLIGVSTSGNSANLLAAFSTARRLGVATFGLSGHDGGAMARSVDLDHCLVVESDSVHRVQETHVAIYHILWDLVHTLLADERGGLEAKP